MTRGVAPWPFSSFRISFRAASLFRRLCNRRAAFAKHTSNSFLLTVVELAAKAIIKSRLIDIEGHTLQGCLLRLKDGFGEINQPFSNIERALIPFELTT